MKIAKLQEFLQLKTAFSCWTVEKLEIGEGGIMEYISPLPPFPELPYSSIIGLRRSSTSA
ncbi:hypothetical protein NIES4074_53380 [Cylindrospermum sp. NIES-4074]|nr:hypothetical protein NIES4074_53380 [Cylindrospermum sp. NIES-4074]